MAFKRKQLTEVTAPLPAVLDEEPGKEMMTWTARATTTGEERALGELLIRMDLRSISSTNLLQAWFSYVDSTFVWQDEDAKPVRIFLPRDKTDLNTFTAGWDELPPEIITWIMERVVWVANPHWKPLQWIDTAPLSDEEDEQEKKAT